jgi:predicted nucleic acid-binding protein
MVSHPEVSSHTDTCWAWLQQILAKGARVLIPEIADYEVRRELLRANKTRGLARLNALAHTLEYLPLTTAAMRQAAFFWSEARQQGRPAADDKALDGDVILAAQAVTLGVPDFMIATTNVKHLSRFAHAALWSDIPVTG